MSGHRVIGVCCAVCVRVCAYVCACVRVCVVCARARACERGSCLTLVVFLPDEGLGVFKVNFLKPGRDIGLVKRLFQFELRVGLTPAAPLDKADDAAVLVVRSHLFKVSTKPTRCMCVSTRGVEWTPRQLIDRWPALAAQPGAVVGVHNVRSRLGDVGEVAVSYSNGAVTPPWGGTSRTEVPPMKPGLAFELRFCSPTRCLNFFTDHRDRMLLEGIDLHLLPTRVWKNEFGIPEERTPPKVRRSRSGSSKRARPAAPTAAAAAAAAVATTIPASSAAASVVPSGAGAGAGARRGGIGATRVGPTSAVPPHMQLRRTNSADVVTRPAKRRSVMPAAAQRSHSSDDLRWLGLSPQAQAQEVHSVINLLAAAAELCKDGTPRKFRQSPAKPASVPGMPDFSSPSYRVAPSTSAPHSFRHHHHHQQQYPQQATGQHRQPEAGTHLGTAHIRVRETLCNTPGSALSPALPTPRASNSPDSDCSLSPRPGSVTPQKRPHRAAPLSLSGSLQRAAPLPVSVPMPIATYAPSAQRPAPSSS